MFDSSLPKTIARMVAVLALLGFAAWSFWRYQDAQKQLETLTTEEVPLVTEEATGPTREEILAAVASQVELPADEQPLILTIEQAEELSVRQPFFQGALDGDLVLMYLQSGLGVVYSPSRDLVINSGPLSVESTGVDEASTTPATTAPAATE